MMPRGSRPTVLGVEITPGTRQDLLRAIRQHLDAGDGLLHVVTANPEYVMFARGDQNFGQAIDDAGIVTVDGAGLSLAMRLLHPSVIIERYTGVALTADLAEMSAETGDGLFLLGAGPGMAAQAGEVLQQRYPGARIVGSWGDGSPREADDAETIRRIGESGASIVLVAYGAPAQIYWIARNQQALAELGVKVVSGIGGAFDYISGNTPYAPAIVRRFGMEWLYRLVREPWRWRRQAVLPHFALLVLVAAIRARRRGGVE